MQTISQIREASELLEKKHYAENNFTGAGYFEINTENGIERISTNGALASIEDLLTENEFKFKTILL